MEIDGTFVLKKYHHDLSTECSLQNSFYNLNALLVVRLLEVKSLTC